MVNARNILLVGAALAAGVISFILFFPSDTSRIKHRFEILGQLAAKSEDETELRAAIKARRIREVFTNPCDIEIPSYAISRRFAAKEIPAHVFAARARYLSLSLKFHDIQIEFPDKKTATVDVTGFFKAKTVGGESISEIHKARCRMIKIKKDWFFKRVNETAVLKE